LSASLEQFPSADPIKSVNHVFVVYSSQLQCLAFYTPHRKYFVNSYIYFVGLGYHCLFPIYIP